MTLLHRYTRSTAARACKELIDLRMSDSASATACCLACARTSEGWGDYALTATRVGDAMMHAG